MVTIFIMRIAVILIVLFAFSILIANVLLSEFFVSE